MKFFRKNFMFSAFMVFIGGGLLFTHSVYATTGPGYAEQWVKVHLDTSIDDAYTGEVYVGNNAGIDTWLPLAGASSSTHTTGVVLTFDDSTDTVTLKLLHLDGNPLIHVKGTLEVYDGTVLSGVTWTESGILKLELPSNGSWTHPDSIPAIGNDGKLSFELWASNGDDAFSATVAYQLESPEQLGYNVNDENDTNSYPTPRNPNEIACASTPESANATNINGVSVHWTDVADGNSNIKYQREYTKVGSYDFGSAHYDPIYTDPYTNYRTFGSNPGTEGTYGSRVRAWLDINSNNIIDSGETVSNWSNECYIRYDITPPAVPTGLRRENLSGDVVACSGSIALPNPERYYPMWNDSNDSDFSHYEYSSFNAPSGAQGLHKQILPDSEFIYTQSYQFNGSQVWDASSWLPSLGTYGFTVRTVDTAGNVSAWALGDETFDNSCQITYEETVACNSDADCSEGEYCNDGVCNDENPALSTGDFVTTWKTNPDLPDPLRVVNGSGTSNNTSITIPTCIGAGAPSGRCTETNYNYDVDRDNDGIFDSLGVTGDITHDYGTPGEYTIRIRGAFPHMYFGWFGTSYPDKDRLKIVDVQQRGAIEWKSMLGMFAGAFNLDVSATDAPDLSQVTTLGGMFYDVLVLETNPAMNTWDTSNIEDMSSMFQCDTQGDSSDTYMLISHFNQDISNWDTSNVTNMKQMFFGAKVFNQNLPTDGNKWNVSKVTDMQQMFWKAGEFNGDIKNRDTSSVKNMYGTFGLSEKFNQDISNWDVSDVINMGEMFLGAAVFNQNISGWDTQNVTNMRAMFARASSFNQDIGGWDVSKVTDMSKMFKYASVFDQDLGNWDIQKLTNATQMFSGIALSTPNYDSLLMGWEDNMHNNSVPFDGGESKYCAGRYARSYLNNSDGWSITDAGQDTLCSVCDNGKEVILDYGSGEISFNLDDGYNDSWISIYPNNDDGYTFEFHGSGGNVAHASGTLSFTNAEIDFLDLDFSGGNKLEHHDTVSTGGNNNIINFHLKVAGSGKWKDQFDFYINPGMCLDESSPVCGNEALEEGEECDDGNIENGDGCSSTCQIETPPTSGGGTTSSIGGGGNTGPTPSLETGPEGGTGDVGTGTELVSVDSTTIPACNEDTYLLERLEKLSVKDHFIVWEVPAFFSKKIGYNTLLAVKQFIQRLISLEDTEKRNGIIRNLVCKIEIMKAERGLRHQNIGANSGHDYMDYLLQYIEDLAILQFVQ